MVGRTISHYKVLEKLGEGGMGVVWKAEDTQLRRIVALKFLSSETVGNEEVKARLIREAQASASLDHPNICQVFGIHEEEGQTFIAMAFIDGPALAGRITERPLPLGEALSIAIQIAEGLQEAHEKGIVHRDIKPHNVMLTAKGQVKIMDFGLASLSGRSKLTKSGTTLGTPAYMAPEQLEGGDVDRRADIWALGCVLYEMLTQRTPFDAEYEQAIVYGILNEEPEPVSAQRADVQPEVDRIIAKALAKGREQRYQHADEFAVDVKRLRSDASGARAEVSDRLPDAGGDESPASQASQTARSASSPGRRELAAWFAAAVATLALVTTLVSPERGTPERTLRKLSIVPPTNTVFDRRESPAISPEGSKVAFVAEDRSGAKRLWVQALDETVAHTVAESEGAGGPFWSPDGRTLAYFSNGKLRALNLTAGPSRALASSTGLEGATWNEHGVIVFAPSYSDGRLWRVSAAGGAAEPLTTVAQGEMFHRFPSFLPDGRRFLFVIQASTSEASGLYLGSLDSDEKTRIADIKSRAVYVDPGYLLFAQRRVLTAQPFDLDTCRLLGEPTVVGGRVASAINLFGHAAFSASKDGVLAYESAPLLELAWFDRSGKLLETLGEPGEYSSLSLSSDDQRLAYELLDPETHAGDIWTLDVRRGAPMRLTSHLDWDMMPAWLPAAKGVIFSRYAKLYRTTAAGSDEAEPFDLGDSMAYQPHVSSDGRYVVYGSAGSIRAYSMMSDSDSFAVVEGPFLAQQPQLSPSARWVGYTSTQTGVQEVYVQAFPQSETKIRVSTRGGSQLRWRSDEQELYYVDPAGRLMGVMVQEHQPLKVGQPEVLVEGPVARGATRHRYAVASGGDRFLANGSGTRIAILGHSGIELD